MARYAPALTTQTMTRVLGFVCLLVIVTAVWGCGTSGPLDDDDISTPRTLSGTSTSTPATAEEKFIYDNVAGEPASGPVPQEILDGAKQGRVQMQLAKYLWEHHGLVIRTEGGHYLVPLPVRIPKGFHWPPEVVPYDSSSPRGDPMTPVFLDPDERDLYVQLWRQNATIRIEQGEDGYRHIVQ